MAAIHWFERGEADLSRPEMLACALFMIAHGFRTVKERKQWVQQVRLDRKRALELKVLWICSGSLSGRMKTVVGA